MKRNNFFSIINALFVAGFIVYFFFALIYWLVLFIFLGVPYYIALRGDKKDMIVKISNIFAIPFKPLENHMVFPDFY